MDWENDENLELLRSGMNIGYARVSTHDQHLALQLEVVYPINADNGSRLLPSRLLGMNQPVISPRNGFSGPQSPLLTG